jgi:hypothetical protein
MNEGDIGETEGKREEERTPGKEKDIWDKIGILSRPLGYLLGGLLVAIFSFLTSDYLNRRQDSEMRTRLYTELTGRREESESALRKDMFNSIIETFVKSDTTGFETQVLDLELLTYNFHETLDIEPLFKHLKNKIEREMTDNIDNASLVEEYKGYLHRLEKTAREITSRQLAILRTVGKDTSFKVEFDSNGVPSNMRFFNCTLTVDEIKRDYLIVLEELEPETKEIKIKFGVKTTNQDEQIEIKFSLSYYDFPMIDNTRLSDGQRCSIVLEGFTLVEQIDSIRTDTIKVDTVYDATIALICFPGSYASLKEKQFYDEIIDDLLPDGIEDEDREKPKFSKILREIIYYPVGEPEPADTMRYPFNDLVSLGKYFYSTNWISQETRDARVYLYKIDSKGNVRRGYSSLDGGKDYISICSGDDGDFFLFSQVDDTIRNVSAKGNIKKRNISIGHLLNKGLIPGALLFKNATTKYALLWLEDTVYVHTFDPEDLTIELDRKISFSKGQDFRSLCANANFDSLYLLCSDNAGTDYIKLLDSNWVELKEALFPDALVTGITYHDNRIWYASEDRRIESLPPDTLEFKLAPEDSAPSEN